MRSPVPSYADTYERLVVADVDPGHIDPEARPRPTGVRALLVAVLEVAMADARAAEPPQPRAAHGKDPKHWTINAQWWWLDDPRDESAFGSAAFICHELGLDRDVLAAGIRAQLGARVLPADVRAEYGDGALFARQAEQRPPSAPASAEMVDHVPPVWRDVVRPAVANPWAWDAIVTRDVIAEIRIEAGLAPCRFGDVDDADDEPVADDVVEVQAPTVDDETLATWADVADWAASCEQAPAAADGFVDDFPKIAELYRAKLASCGGVEPPERGLRAEASLELLAIMLGVHVAPGLDAVALLGPRGLYDGSGKLGQFVASLCAGTSLREACRRADLAKRTGGIVLGACEALLGQPFRCRCGISLRAHRGWCADRVAKSPARQAVVARLVEAHARRGGMLPMVLGQDDDGRVIFTPSESRSYGPDHGAKLYCLACHHGMRASGCRRRGCPSLAEPDADPVGERAAA